MTEDVFRGVRKKGEPEHEIRAKTTIEEEQRFMLHPDGDQLEFSGKVADSKTLHQNMYFCVCDRDRHFRKEETAIEHLEDVGALD